MRDLIKATKAISDETRIRILNLILQRECCVCEVMQALDISQTRASRNLNILYEAGFLEYRKDGLWALYSMRKGLDPRYASLVNAIRSELLHNETARLDVERLQKAERIGASCSAKK